MVLTPVVAGKLAELLDVALSAFSFGVAFSCWSSSGGAEIAMVLTPVVAGKLAELLDVALSA